MGLWITGDCANLSPRFIIYDKGRPTKTTYPHAPRRKEVYRLTDFRRTCQLVPCRGREHGHHPRKLFGRRCRSRKIFRMVRTPRAAERLPDAKDIAAPDAARSLCRSLGALRPLSRLASYA